MKKNFKKIKSFPIRSYLSCTISLIAGGISSYSYANDLNDTNIDLINTFGPTSNVVLTSPNDYVSDNDILTGHGRWLDMLNNNSSSFDLTITAPSITVKNYHYTTSNESDPGGALVNKGNINLNGNISFIGNQLTTTNSGSTSRADDANGGAISSSKTVTINAGSSGSVVFENNSVEVSNAIPNNRGVNAFGGAIFGLNGVNITGTDNTSVEFKGNSVKSINYSAYGGAIYSLKDITLSGDQVSYLFDNNSATGAGSIGGALYVGNSSGNISKIDLNATNSIYTFSNNKAIATVGAANGGAIGTAGGGANGIEISMNADNTSYIFNNNSAESTMTHKGYASYGGAIYIGGSLKFDGQTSQYQFNGNQVIGDQAYGGALAVVTTAQMYENSGNGSQLGSLFLSNSSVTNNSAKVDINNNLSVSAYGGAIYLAGANLTMTGSNVISGNSATAKNDATNDASKILAAGGAIYATTSVRTVSNTYENTEVDMNFQTNTGESIVFSNNYYSTTNKNGDTVRTDNDIYWDANPNAGGGLHNVTINTAENSSVEMLSSVASSDAANVNINKTGAGTWVLGGESQLLGKTQINVNGGYLKLNDSDTKVTLNSAKGSLLSIGTQGNLIGNYGTINGNVTNSGAIYVGDISTNPTSSNNSFTINGDYTGNNGILYLKTELEDDNSLTDKLIITGDATGSTSVSISNLGGQGAQTIEGIKVVDVGGTSSNDAFEASNIVAGRYEYSLVKGNASGTDTESWFLSSRATGDPTIRPEGGSYLANLVAANNLFNLRLHDRLGETQYTDLFTGEQKITSMWLRARYGYDKYKDNSGQLTMKANWNLVQLGGDIAQWSSNRTDRFHLGIMGGYGRSSNKIDSNSSVRKSDSVVDGYSLGLYATWYSNEEDKTGLYVDSWVQWSDFDATVNSTGNASEKYNLDGFSASLESGYSFLSTSWTDYSLWLQPKGQITWMNVDADKHVESNGTVVKGNSNNIQTRLGLKISLNNNDVVYEKQNQGGQLFVEMNWLHNFNPFEVIMDGESVSQAGARNIGEIKTGVEGNVGKNTNLWFNFAHQRGDHNYSNSSIMLGAKYSF